MKKILINCLIICSIALFAKADFIGAEAGIGMWSSSFSGEIKGDNTNDFNLDVKDDLGFDDTESNVFLWAYLDHPLPLLPNIKIQKLNYSTKNTYNTNVIFDGINYNGSVGTELTLNQIDLIFYYRILDNWINFDLGFQGKMIDGTIKITDGVAVDTDKEFDLFLPMLYAKSRIDFPFLSNLSVETQASYIGFGDSSYQDIQAGIAYEIFFGLGINVGYKMQTIKIQDIDDIYTDLKVSGPYAAIFYNF